MRKEELYCEDEDIESDESFEFEDADEKEDFYEDIVERILGNE